MIRQPFLPLSIGFGILVTQVGVHCGQTIGVQFYNASSRDPVPTVSVDERLPVGGLPDETCGFNNFNPGAVVRHLRRHTGVPTLVSRYSWTSSHILLAVGAFLLPSEAVFFCFEKTSELNVNSLCWSILWPLTMRIWYDTALACVMATPIAWR